MADYADAFIIEARERISGYAEVRGGAGVSGNLGATIDGSGKKGIEIGGGEGAGVSAGFGVRVKLFDIGPSTPGAPVVDEFSITGGVGVGGGLHLTFLDGHVFSASISLGAEEGLTIQNTLSRSFDVQEPLDPKKGK